MEKIKINSGLIILFLISLIPLLNLLNHGLPITHDSLLHIARIANFYDSLREGILIPRWAENLNWGYGHPTMMFLYPLPYYFSSFIHFTGFSYADSFKITLGFSYTLSGLFMYLWLKEFLNKYSAFFGSILFLFAPYRFIDIYVRGALGENAAFIFMPLVLLALYKLNKNKKYYKIKNYYINIIFTSISFCLLILTHNAISLIFIPFIIFYIFYLFLENKNKINLTLSIFSLFFGLLYSFFFWFPAFTEGKYTLREIVTKDVYIDRFVSIKNLLYSPWKFGITGEFSVSIGIIHLIILFFSVLLFIKLIKSKDKIKYLYWGTFIFFLISVFLMLPYSNIIWSKITTLQKLQFPWRFLTITTFTTSLIGAIFVEKINIKNKKIFIIILSFITIIITSTYWHAKNYKIYNDSVLEKKIPSTSDTGESSPIWSIISMDKYPKDDIEIIEGDSKIVKYIRKSTYHEYLIDTKNKTRIRENTLYFPGWNIYDNYKIIDNIQFQDPSNRGIMTFYLNPGLHDLILKFEDTKVRKISYYITLISILLTLLFPIIFILFPKIKINKYKW